MTMEHFIRIALWIVALSGCLQAIYKTTTAAPVKYSDFHFKELTDTLNCEDLTLYSPHPDYVKDGCFYNALHCTFMELNGTVRDECTGDHTSLNDTVEALSMMIGSHTLNNSTKCACDNLRRDTPYREFVHDLESLIRKK